MTSHDTHKILLRFPKAKLQDDSDGLCQRWKGADVEDFCNTLTKKSKTLRTFVLNPSKKSGVKIFYESGHDFGSNVGLLNGSESKEEVPFWVYTALWGACIGAILVIMTMGATVDHMNARMDSE